MWRENNSVNMFISIAGILQLLWLAQWQQSGAAGTERQVPLYLDKPSLLSNVFNGKGKTWNSTSFSSQMFKCLKFWQSLILTWSSQQTADLKPVEILKSAFPDSPSPAAPYERPLVGMNRFSLNQWQRTSLVCTRPWGLIPQNSENKTKYNNKNQVNILDHGKMLSIEATKTKTKN